MRKKLIGLAVMALSLAGCASSPDSAFLNELRSEAPNVLESGSEDQAIELAKLMCSNMEDGATGFSQADLMLDSGFDLGESGAFVRAAVENYCPKNSDKID